MSHLYIVGTPIGNLEDISLRALRIMKEVDLILAEDTRNTRKILNHYEINTPTSSFHEHSKEGVYEKIIERLGSGEDLAFVTDAGMPGISDPGGKLVKRVREQSPETEISTIPGPSALTSAISISGAPISEFYFAGFSPTKKGRQTFFQNIPEKVKGSSAVIFYESTHRILNCLENLVEFAPENTVYVFKELTKIFEEVIMGKPEEVLKKFSDMPEKVKGEFVVMVI
jgi:16S rRNA (cytidine1402-2'-O)-methyltransferase